MEPSPVQPPEAAPLLPPQAQLCFDFVDAGTQPALPLPPADAAERNLVPTPAMELPPDSIADADEKLPRGPDAELESQCRQLLLNLGIESATSLIKVIWNPRLKSTAGYARYPTWRIELNPRLHAFPGQVDRTLRHELAHLIAYHRAQRRIEPHGREWRQACADLGIPGEAAHHHLPLPRERRSRPHAYQCPACHVVIHRARPFRQATACLACCRKHNRGEFDARFQFMKVQIPEPSAS